MLCYTSLTGRLVDAYRVQYWWNVDGKQPSETPRLPGTYDLEVYHFEPFRQHSGLMNGFHLDLVNSSSLCSPFSEFGEVP
jgi:hypothetical protein